MGDFFRHLGFRWDHNALTVLATLALGVSAVTVGLHTAAPGAERHDAVFQPELDEICTNLTGRAVFDGRSLGFNDGDTQVRHLPPAWQRGEPATGEIVIDGDEQTFFADDGVVLHFDDRKIRELYCTLG